MSHIGWKVRLTLEQDLPLSQLNMKCLKLRNIRNAQNDKLKGATAKSRKESNSTAAMSLVRGQVKKPFLEDGQNIWC